MPTIMQGLRPHTPAKGLVNPLETLLNLLKTPEGVFNKFG